MITVKLNDIVNSVEALLKLAQRDMSGKLAWEIGRLLRAVESELQGFNEARMNLIKKYGEKKDGELVTDEKDNCKIPDEFVLSFTNELNELVNAEVEINARKIALSACEELEFKPADMIALAPFIEEDEEE